MRLVVLVTGASGQLGQALHHIAKEYAEIDFVFCNSKTLDVTDKAAIKSQFEKHQPNFCINAAAYTAVDKAEQEPEKVIAINTTAAQYLAEVCDEFNVQLLLVSTDFVFDGLALEPYLETDLPNLQSVYGQTKLASEKAIQAVFSAYFTVRTSWVYSQFAGNFMKTMLRLRAERDSLSVVYDQIGTPTHAVDLAHALVQIILFASNNPNHQAHGLYHYSNEGSCSRFEFIQKIFEINSISIALRPYFNKQLSNTCKASEVQRFK